MSESEWNWNVKALEMPDRQVERLRGFLQPGGGRLSKRAREQEFAALTGAEAGASRPCTPAGSIEQNRISSDERLRPLDQVHARRRD